VSIEGYKRYLSMVGLICPSVVERMA